jgi:DNA-binding LacI/PurR family transcriptional regulator
MKVKTARSEPSKRATLKDLAEALNVAPSTVSNAYNRPDQLSKDLRERILQTAKDMGYSGPHPVARGLRQQRMGVIGVLFGEHLSYAFSDPAAVIFMQGVSQATEVERFGLTIVPVPRGASHDSFGVRHAAVDGFIAYCLTHEGLVESVLERGLPLVLVDHTPRPDVPGINVQDEHGAQMAARHLIEQGHQNIGVLTMEISLPPRVGWANDLEQAKHTIFEATRGRLTGYIKELVAAGLVWNEGISVYECNSTLEQGRQGLRAILERNPSTTAILTMSDVLALGVLEEARNLKLRVPEDLAIVGFDDVPEAARAGLSSVSQPHLEKGRMAGEMLIRRLRGEAVTSPERFHTRLVVRGSSAAPIKKSKRSSPGKS